VVLFLGYAVVPGAVFAGFGKSHIDDVQQAPVGDAVTNGNTLTIEEAK
jgi:hypothetical protein